MDWAKAKTILIIALIITDIFLLYNYVSGHRGSGEIDNTEMLMTVLSESGINISEIPEGHQDMPALTVKHVDTDDETIKALIESVDITVDSDEHDKESAYIEAASDFIEYLGMMSIHAEAEYEALSDSNRNNNTANADAIVRFRCFRNNYEVDGSYMVCTFDDGKLTGFESNWLEPVEFSRKKLPTISASVALISFMTDHSPEDIVTIENMDMVYWVSPDYYDGGSVMTDTALPAWRIVLDDGRQIHIDAIELTQ